MTLSLSSFFGCVVAHDPSRADALIRLSRDFTPRFELERDSIALLDLSGLTRLFRNPEELGDSLRETAVRLGIEAPSIALAPRLASARRLALFRPGLTIARDFASETELLGALPLESLELDAKTLARLRDWGLRRSSDLSQLPAAELRARGGAELVRAHASSEGREDRLLAPVVEKSDDSLFVDPGFGVEDLSQLAFLMFRLLDPLCAKLRASSRAATAFEMTLALEDGTTDVRLLRSPSPSADDRAWRTLLRLSLEGRPPVAPVLSALLRAESTSARPVQFSFTGSGRSSPEKVASVLARLQRFYPPERVGSPRLVDTHAPDRFELLPFDPVSSGKSRQHHADPRIEPARPAAAVRVIRPPVVADVRVDAAGAPVFVHASDSDRFVDVRGRVRASAGPFHLSTEWWNEEAFAREEWDVEIASGDASLLCRIFRDPRNDTWYLIAEID